MNRKKTVDKIIVFFLIGMLVVSAIQVNQLVSMAFAQSDNWYVGKGVKPNTSVSYTHLTLPTNREV